MPEIPSLTLDLGVKYCKKKFTFLTDIDVISAGGKAVVCLTLLNSIAGKKSILKQLLLKPPLIVPKIIAGKLPIVYYGLTTVLLTVGVTETATFLTPVVGKYCSVLFEKGREAFIYTLPVDKPQISMPIEVPEAVNVQHPTQPNIQQVRVPDVNTITVEPTNIPNEDKSSPTNTNVGDESKRKPDFRK